MTPQVLAKALVHWLALDQGGRSCPPSGPIYAATGRFADQDELFSVVLRFLEKKEQAENNSVPRVLDEAELGFLASELVKQKLTPGTKLLITEGSRTVAECEIQSV